MATPYRVTFVCSGNICRSPMAESVLRSMLAAEGLADAVRVDSFGLGDWHIGEPTDGRALTALRSRGYDIVHRAQVIDPQDLSEQDLVVAIDRDHERALHGLAATAEDTGKIILLRSFDDTAGDDLDVPDPYYGGPAEFERVLDMIEVSCRGLVADLAKRVADRPTR